MPRQGRNRPYTSLPVGFVHDHALDEKQLHAYFMLSELGVRRYADRYHDEFTCTGSELNFALGGMGVANAIRRIRTLPTDLASIRDHPERRGVYVVSLPGFAEIQGLAAGEVASTQHAAGSSVAEHRQISGPAAAGARPVGGPRVAGGADNPKPERRQLVAVPSPSHSPSTTPSPSPAEDGHSPMRKKRTASTKETFPDRLPDTVRAGVLAGRRFLNPTVQQVMDDPNYLDNEWARCGAYHRREGTQPRVLEAVFKTWLRNSQTGERAHEYLKQQTESVAASGILGSGGPTG